MPPSVSDIETQALLLTPEERARLADRLLTSLAPDEAVEDAWALEVERRIADLEAGKVTAVPVEDALLRARAAIR